MQNNDSHLPAVAEPKTLGRRTLVRGAAWAAPVVGMAATAPAYAASNPAFNAFRLPLLTFAGWEWGNPSNDILARGLTVCTTTDGQRIPAGSLKITLQIHDNIKSGALCPNTEMRVKPNGMTFVSGLNGWGGDTDWTFADVSTGSGSTRDAKWEFTYQGTLEAGSCVRLSFNADVDIYNSDGTTSGCGLRITRTPNMTYSMSAPGYTTTSRTLIHTNDVV